MATQDPIQSLLYAGSLLTTDMLAIQDCLKGPDGRYAGDQALRGVLKILLDDTENMLREAQALLNVLDSRGSRGESR